LLGRLMGSWLRRRMGFGLGFLGGRFLNNE
jgi:hypothetical protein